MNELLDAISALCADGRTREPWLDGDLTLLQGALGGLGPLRTHESDELPVVAEHLARAVDLASDPLARSLAEAVLARSAELPWRRSFSYDDAPEMKGFLDGYAVLCLAGPDIPRARCVYRSETVTFGLSLQAPNLYYPAHAHRAVELYCIIGGAVDWQQGDGVWRRLGSGAFVRHGPDEPHAMQTREAPLLSFFAWVSDLHEPVYLAAPGPATDTSGGSG